MKHFLTILLISSSSLLMGQDILGGEIEVSHITGLTYQSTIRIYTKTSVSGNDSLIKFNGSALSATLTTLVLPNDVTEWTYLFQKTYPSTSPTPYIDIITDSSRISNLINVTNSSTEKLTLIHNVVINPLLGINNTPVFLNKPTALYQNSGLIYHNPIVVDIDGDSLYFTLIPTSTANYTFPVGATINSSTGLFSMPIIIGSHAIAIQVDEWRNGTYMRSSVREMVIDSSFLTSIETLEESQISIYPNPTSGQITISSEKVIASSITIRNSLGEILLSDRHPSSNQIFNLSNNPKGIYLLQVETDNGIITKKIIKQ